MNQLIVTNPIAFSFGIGLNFNRGLSLLLRFPLLHHFECFTALFDPLLRRSLAGLKLDAFLYFNAVEDHFDGKRGPRLVGSKLRILGLERNINRTVLTNTKTHESRRR